jgi:predicted dehydrogenase
MNLTPEQQELGRRNFLKALAGTPALAALAAGAAMKGPVKGGPVRVGYIGVGGQGRVLLEQTDPAYADVLALADINPLSLGKADDVLKKKGLHPARHYTEWKDMLEKENLEAVIMAPPLWMHADIASGCMEAGKHVLCEKMMAWDDAGCERMRETARKTGKILEIGYQRNYNPIYQAAHEGIVKAGQLGDVYHARIVWHRNGTWRRKGEPPSADYDPSRWGYPDYDHLINWRLYWKYSRGLHAELASHQVNIVNWFFGAEPEEVVSSGGVYRFPEGGREVPDHVYTILEYPHGRTAVFTSIESNAYDHYYEAFYGTKGTLILRGETEAYLFDEGGGERPTTVDVTPKASGPALDASESRSAEAAGSFKGGAPEKIERVAAYRLEVSGFCASIRTGKPLLCGPDRAIGSAKACIRAAEAVEKKTTRLGV